MSAYKDYRLSADTTDDAEQRYFELLKTKTPAEKLKMVSQMSAAVRTLAINGLRERHPNETELSIKCRLVRMVYGDDVPQEFYERLRKLHNGDSRTD